MSTLRTDTLQTTDSSFTIDIVDLIATAEESAQLRVDLADDTDPAKGSALVGHEGSTVKAALDTLARPAAVGQPSTLSDPNDVDFLTTRLHELHKASTFTMDGNFEMRALRGPKFMRACQLTRNSVFSVPDSVITPVTWVTVAYDNEQIFSASTPSRLTVPLNATAVRVSATVSFEANATGGRAAYIYKNGVEMPGARVTSTAVNGIVTALKVSSDAIQAVPGDYFEVRVFQNSGGAINLDVFSTFCLEVTQWTSRTYEGKRMLIMQGLYQDYENGDGITDVNLTEMAENAAQYNVVVLSHVATWSNGAGCLDSKFPFITRLIRAIRNINPNVKIFGYIEGTASAPSGCGYAPGTRYIDTGWTVATPTREIERIQQWNNLPGARPDGIFIDLVSEVYMAPAHRDNIYSAIKGLGFSIMSNTTYPSFLNVRFACSSTWFGRGDYACIEGFSTSAGVNVLADTNLALAEIALWRQKGIRLAALCSEALATTEGQTVNTGSANNLNAVSLFNANYFRGDVYQYDFADLGIVSKIIQVPGIT